MPDIIVNPRRAQRAPARCEARCLLPGGGFWATDTSDVSARGCQLSAPGPFAPGDSLELVLSAERVPGQLAAAGTVAWASRAAPWRIGVTFDERHREAAARWFEALLAAHPGLDTFQLAPESLPVEAIVHLGPAPRVAPELTGEELAVLRATGDGVALAALRERLGHDWPVFEGLVFSMIGKRLLAVSPAPAGDRAGWAAVLDAP